MVTAMITAAGTPPEPKAISTANAPAIHAPTKGMKEVKKYKMKIGTANGICRTGRIAICGRPQPSLPIGIEGDDVAAHGRHQLPTGAGQRTHTGGLGDLSG